MRNSQLKNGQKYEYKIFYSISNASKRPYTKAVINGPKVFLRIFHY